MDIGIRNKDDACYKYSNSIHLLHLILYIITFRKEKKRKKGKRLKRTKKDICDVKTASYQRGGKKSEENKHLQKFTRQKKRAWLVNVLYLRTWIHSLYDVPQGFVVLTATHHLWLLPILTNNTKRNINLTKDPS